jgi:succinyl-diaminopimelate desuccinylase
MNPCAPAEILKKLIKCRSVTPADGGGFDVLQSLLDPLGFAVERRIFSDTDTPDVENLYARLGKSGPHLLFAGHNDVVPPGAEAAWRHPPFSGVSEGGFVFGRGAVDMKGAIACFIAAAARYIERYGKPAGSLSLLITGDEEGPSVNGTDKMLKWAQKNGQSWDAAIVGEPTCRERIGDVVKIGRRGSLSGRITVTGTQGHSAYPQLADNPIYSLMDLIDALLVPAIDEGSENFEPTCLVITSFDVGNTARNVIPQSACALFNVRFNDLWNGDQMRREIVRRLDEGTFASRFREVRGGPVRYEIEWIARVSEVFHTRDEELIARLSDAVEHVTGLTPERTTGGGTSDARYIKDYCPVFEFGLVGQTMHQIDERVAIADLETLTSIYLLFLENWFGNR